MGEGEDEALAEFYRAEAGGGDPRVLEFIRTNLEAVAQGNGAPLPVPGASEEVEAEVADLGPVGSREEVSGRVTLPFKAQQARVPAVRGVRGPVSNSSVHSPPFQILELMPFRLDKFQERAFKWVLQGYSVVVCAPTGAGKTAIAETSSIAMLAAGRRVIYTTPLKALSNQKLYELREKFGSDRIGLQTGDVSLNTEADITVMTTEVLRNIMYRSMESPELLMARESDPAATPEDRAAAGEIRP